MKLADIKAAEHAVQRAIIAAECLGASRADTKPLRDAQELLQEVRHFAYCLADRESTDAPRHDFAVIEMESRLIEFIRHSLWAK